MNFNKTAVAIAICSSLVVTSAVATEKHQKYNFSHQKNISIKNAKVKTDRQDKLPSAWLIEINTPSLAQLAANQGKLSKKVASNAIGKIASSQKIVTNAILNLHGKVDVVAQTKNLISGVIVKADEKSLLPLLSNSAVKRISPIYDYDINVEASAEYMKGAALVQSGVASGKNVRVAVLDTGVDYTHAVFGGSGTVAAYNAAVADQVDVPAWPQGNIVGGYDFVNDDPNPIDIDTLHGTHVSHSVIGLAPDAELYVYSVCAGGCSGVAQVKALEAAMDPNGDGDISDRVDVINMSLGGNFGTTRGGAVQEMLDNAALLGVNEAISAGNDGPTPFIVGGPSTTKNALSVGAMTHPTTPVGHLTSTFNGSDLAVASANFGPMEFSISSADFPMVYPEANQTGCDAFADSVDFTDKTVLIDRGACAFTDKVKNAQDKGAKFVVIVNNVADGGPIGLGGSDDTVTIPAVGISMEDGAIIKDALSAGGDISFAFMSEMVNAAGAIASFTSRGPSADGWLKPEITAPGVNILTASPGTGDKLSPISGTSFSSPMTAGSLALLKEALPNRSALELKATLMNAANLDVTMEARTLNPDAGLAPISYIGSGLVDVEKAANLPVAAWDKNTKQAALAFGLMNLSSTTSITKTVTIKNFSASAKNHSLSLNQRFADDEATGAIAFDYPATITVPAGNSMDFDVTLTIDPSKLPEWTLGADKLASTAGGNDLTTLEYDGSLEFTGGDENFHLVYHVIPKASASVDVAAVINDTGVKRFVTNNGAKDLNVMTVPLTVDDEVGDSSYLDMQAASVEVLSVPTTFCPSGYVVDTTFTMASGMLSLNVGGFYVDYDLDGDGKYDFAVQAFEHNVFGDYPLGENVSFTSPWGAYNGFVDNLYFTSGNNFATLEHCIEAIGLTDKDLGNMHATVRFRVSDSQWDSFSDYALDSATVTNFDFAVSSGLAMLVDDSGAEVDTLAVGNTAQLSTSGDDFVMLSDAGSQPLVATPTKEEGVAPVVTAGQTFAVDENTANGTVIGNVIATDPDLYTSPVSEYFVESSSSTAVMMDRDGTIKVADTSLLDYDAGLTSITLNVVAIDTAGRTSSVEVVTVNINNLKDEASELPQPAPARVKKGGGSFGWLSLVLLPLAWTRRKQK